MFLVRRGMVMWVRRKVGILGLGNYTASPPQHHSTIGRKEAGTLGNRKPRAAAEENPQEEAMRQE